MSWKLGEINAPGRRSALRQALVAILIMRQAQIDERDCHVDGTCHWLDHRKLVFAAQLRDVARHRGTATAPTKLNGWAEARKYSSINHAAYVSGLEQVNETRRSSAFGTLQRHSVFRCVRSLKSRRKELVVARHDARVVSVDCSIKDSIRYALLLRG